MTPTPTTINFKKIHGVDSHILNVIADKMNRQRYNTHDGYGYVVKSQDDSHVLGYLIIDYPTYIMEFDMDEMATKKIKTMKKLAIEFLIDLEYNLIEIYSNKKNVGLVINEIGKLSEYVVSIEDVYFRAKDVINKLNDKSIEYSIKNLRIRDFSINKHTIGSFFVKVLENHEGVRLINEYNSTITYTGLNLSINTDEISIGLYESGALRIYNKLYDSTELTSILKEKLFRSEK